MVPVATSPASALLLDHDPVPEQEEEKREARRPSACMVPVATSPAIDHDPGAQQWVPCRLPPPHLSPPVCALRAYALWCRCCCPPASPP
jgi:hypothetical protein